MGERIKLRNGNTKKCCVANTVFEEMPVDRREKTLPSESMGNHGLISTTIFHVF